ncbi:MAG: TRAP transporter large permease subunit [Gammaproteobacteria bacterium]|nr:TRAP transporter large permease subunit [Gammaproteobacteria bacterium]
MIWAGIVVVVLMALLGAPLFAIVLAGAMLGFLAAGDELALVAINIYGMTDKPLLLALPFFTFAGYLMAEAKSSERLMALTRSLFGWMPAGLAIVGFVACAAFTALTGASGVTIVALGALLLPMLKSSGFGERFSLGLVTTSGSLGVLIVPAVPLILYGVIAQQMAVGESFTIQQLFLGGIGPVLLMLALLAAWTVWRYGGGPRLRLTTAGSRRGLPSWSVYRTEGVPRTPFDPAELWRAAKAARWELPLPLVVLGGIYSGLFAISEAAAMTALYVLIVEVGLYREVSLKALPGVIRESMVMVGSILLILGVALAFTDFLIGADVPQRLFAFMQEHVTSALTFLILLNIVLLALGAILDIFSAIIIMVPLLLPVAVGYGIHPIHLGIIFLANLQIGYFTPPIGMNLFIASYRFDRPVLELYAACLPFMAVLLVALLIITYVPALSLWFL